MPRVEPGGKPVEAKPTQGGRLMSGMSSESVGINNYTRKEEFRRVLDREVRAEGYDAYRPNPVYDRMAQSIPPNAGGAITLVSEVELGDGRITLIAGNATTLWRYFGLEAPGYFDTEAAATYFDNEAGATYYDENPKGWIQIGSGFSGGQWEHEQVGDYIVLNNGVDLPMTYRLDEYQVRPIYELREQQVASVGTICTLFDVLICMDIRQINDAAFYTPATATTPASGLMADIPAPVPASQDNTGLVTPNAATLFPGLLAASLIGKSMFWVSGEQRVVTSIDANGFLHVNNDVPVAAGPCSVENPAAYAAFTDATKIQRFGWRVFPSMPSQPRRFGAVVTVSMTAGSADVNFNYPVRSLSELYYTAMKSAANLSSLPSVYVLQAALGAGNLISPVAWIPHGSAKSMRLTQKCYNTIAGLPCEAADSQASYAGVYQDLVDDGSAIMRGKQLRDSVVIYKEPSTKPAVFIATYNGAQAAPFAFQKIELPNTGQALHYKGVIVNGGGGYYGSHHIYAGRDAFYKFDLFQMTPTEVPQLTDCKELFFNQADRATAFVVENHLTRELFFGYGIGGGALCMDYAQGTVRTTAIALTCAAKARHPVNGSDWFVMGMADGTVKRYGLLDAKPRNSGTITASSGPNGALIASGNFFKPDDVGTTVVLANGAAVAVDTYVSPTKVIVLGMGCAFKSQSFALLPGIWHWAGATYNSIMESGLDDFGMGNSEKAWNEYSLVASSKSPTAKVVVDFRGGSNPGTGVDLQRGTIKQPQLFNNLRPTIINYYLGDRVTVTGFGPFEISGRMFNIQPINSHGFGNLGR